MHVNASVAGEDRKYLHALHERIAADVSRTEIYRSRGPGILAAELDPKDPSKMRRPSDIRDMVVLQINRGNFLDSTSTRSLRGKLIFSSFFYVRYLLYYYSKK